MWQAIKSFLSRPMTWAGLAVGAVAAVAARIYQLNDFTPAPQHPPKDFSNDLAKLDPTRPVGVFMYHITPQETAPVIASIEPHVINAVHNNFKERMQKHYGDNFVVINNATPEELMDFSQQFNNRFAGAKPEVHFVANHHQDDYDDRQLAAFLQSVDAKSKRALIMSCGPDSKAYDVPGFDYIILPRADGQKMGPDISLKFGPAYVDAIEWMKQSNDPKFIQQKFSERGGMNELRDKLTNVMYGGPFSAAPPVVVTPGGVTPKPTPIPSR